MSTIKVELRNYAVEIALHDFPSVISTKYLMTEEQLIKQKETWMSPYNDKSWRNQTNSGYAHGILFDSNLDIVVKNENDEQIDHFKGSDCFYQACVTNVYSSVSIRSYSAHITSPRVTGMEITEKGFCSSVFELNSRPYERDKILFNLRRVIHIRDYNGKGKLLCAEAFILDPAWLLYKLNNDGRAMHEDYEFSKTGAVQQYVFAHRYSCSGSNMQKTLNKMINKKDCDSLYKHFISKKNF